MQSNADNSGEVSATSARGAARLERNIQSILKRREEEKRARKAHDMVSEAITKFAGSMTFVYLHLVFFGAWIWANLGIVPGLPKFDPTFATLAMVASVEAIFISTFVLISQNRMAARDDERADLNLQISLLAEQEATYLITLASAIASRLDVKTRVDEDVGDLAAQVTPEEVMTRIENQKRHLDE